MEIIWGMEKMSYTARLWSYGNRTILEVYTHFTKWDMPSPKGLMSLKNSVQKKQLDKFRLEMRHAFLILTMINHCHQLQNKMIDTPSLDALQRFGCIFIAHYCIEDCADCVTLDNVLYRMSVISHSKCQINLWGYAKSWCWMLSLDRTLFLKIPC